MKFRLAAFLRDHLPRDRGTSRHTVDSYALCFKLLVVFAAEKYGIRPCTLDIGHLDIATLLEFLEHLERDRGNGVRTRNARLAAIKAFFRFLEFRHPGHLDLAAQVRQIPAKKGDVPLIGSLDRAETRALLDAPDPGTVAGTRDRAMLCLTYNAGLRVSELVGIAVDDLKMPALDEVHIIGKGRRKRILPLWKETRSALREWLAVRPESTDRHLFLNAMGTGMTRRGFAKRLALHAQTAARSVPSTAGKTVSPHLLRHTCAIHTLKATGDVRKVSLWLGHASLQTTEMYLQADPTDKLDTLHRWRPPSLKKGKFKGVKDELLAMLASPSIRQYSGNLSRGQSLENQRSQRLRFPES